MSVSVLRVRPCSCLVFFFSLCVLLAGSAAPRPACAAVLTWQTDFETAVTMAQEQGKKVLYVAGRDTCGNTTYVKNTACESSSVKSLIEEHYIPLYYDVDEGYDYWDYADGLGTQWVLPLIVTIHPDAKGTYISRSTGVQYSSTLADRLAANASYKIAPALGGLGLAGLGMLLGGTGLVRMRRGNRTERPS